MNVTALISKLFFLLTYCKNSVAHLQKQKLHIPEKMIFLKLFLKVVLSEFMNMSQQGSIKIFLKTFYERFLEKKHKNINDNRHILVHILFIY